MLVVGDTKLGGARVPSNVNTRHDGAGGDSNTSPEWRKTDVGGEAMIPTVTNPTFSLSCKLEKPMV